MSKFILTGILLVLLGSFLHYSPEPEILTKEQREIQSKSRFPISEQIKLARMSKRMSERELANKVGVSILIIEKIEKGKAIPTNEELAKIEQVLGISLVGN